MSDNHFEKLRSIFNSQHQRFAEHANKFSTDLKGYDLGLAAHHYRECKTFFRNMVDAYEEADRYYNNDVDVIQRMEKIIAKASSHIDLMRDRLAERGYFRNI